MASSRSKQIIALAVIVVLIVAGLVYTLHALRGTGPIFGGNTGMVCQHRLSWATDNAGATLLSVVALNQQDAWAAGVKEKSAVIMHWDSSSWSDAPLPTLASTSSTLNAIAAVNANDLWAAGIADLQPLMLHWNGQAWSQVNTAPITAYSAQFSALAVVSSTDVWAMGNALQRQSNTPSSFVQHWDGHSWRVVPTPQGTNFVAIAANSAGAVWGITSTADNAEQIVQWNGHAWQQALTPDSNAKGLNLQTLAVGADGTIWVAGSYWPSGANWAAPILEHWDGKAWMQAPISEPEARGAWLTNLSFGTDGAVWAAGTLRNDNTRLSNVFMEQISTQGTTERFISFSLYPSFYNDPHNGDSFNVTGMAAVPGANAAWVIGSTGSVPNPYQPPIDSNLPVASGGFMLSYC